jgi:hypothetical protein
MRNAPEKVDPKENCGIGRKMRLQRLIKLRVLDDEGDDENENGVGDEEQDLELVPEVALAPALALPVLLGVGDTGLRVSV